MGYQKYLKKMIKSRLLFAMVLTICCQPIECLKLQDYAARLWSIRTPTRKELMMVGAGVLLTAAAVYFLKNRKGAAGPVSGGHVVGGGLQEQLRKKLDQMIQEVCKGIGELETKLRKTGKRLSIANEGDREKVKTLLNITNAMWKSIEKLVEVRDRLYFGGIKMILLKQIEIYSWVQEVFSLWSANDVRHVNFDRMLTSLLSIMPALINRIKQYPTSSSGIAETDMSQMFYLLGDLNLLTVLITLRDEIVTALSEKELAALANKISVLETIGKQNFDYIMLTINIVEQTSMYEFYKKLSEKIGNCTRGDEEGDEGGVVTTSSETVQILPFSSGQ